MDFYKYGGPGIKYEGQNKLPSMIKDVLVHYFYLLGLNPNDGEEIPDDYQDMDLDHFTFIPPADFVIPDWATPHNPDDESTGFSASDRNCQNPTFTQHNLKETLTVVGFETNMALYTPPNLTYDNDLFLTHSRVSFSGSLKITVVWSHVKNLQKVTKRTKQHFVSIVLINKSIFFNLCIVIVKNVISAP